MNTVPPAELEAVLFTHPDIADAAVIGVDSVEQATELPRFVHVPYLCPLTLL
jgi:4-coumarate--CoA ligase